MKASRARSKRLSPLARAHPECLLRVLVSELDVVGGEAGRVAVAVAVDREPVAVVAVQALGGAEPHEAAAVLVDGRDARAGEAVVGGERPELKLLGVRTRAREREGAYDERSSPDSRTKAPDGRRRVGVDAKCGSAWRHLYGKASINDARNRVLQQRPVRRTSLVGRRVVSGEFQVTALAITRHPPPTHRPSRPLPRRAAGRAGCDGSGWRPRSSSPRKGSWSSRGRRGAR